MEGFLFAAAGGEASVAHKMVLLAFQLGVILFAAKLAGEFTERVLKQPGVLGELVVGILIGPYMLGGQIHVPGLGTLFPVHPGNIPVSTELYAVAQLAVILLLFLAGLETDLEQFFLYLRPAVLVGLGGVIFPFFFGAFLTQFWGLTPTWTHPEALFIGAAMVATSVGITARVLSDIKRLNTPEGVTILAAAVVDDVLGILVLAIVLSIAEHGEVSIAQAGWIAFKAAGIWVVLLAVGLLLADPFVRWLKRFQSSGAAVAMAFAMGLLFAAVAEMFGLAMIIGAYAAGLALSKTDYAEELFHHLEGLGHVLVPVFFVVMGMLVNPAETTHALAFGVVLTLLAVVGKVLGCGLPALASGFNLLGATRIGIGMLPRGEVALIVAGVALSRGAIPQDIYGVAVFMTMITTLLAPIFLVPLFSNLKSGVRVRATTEEVVE